MDTHMVLVKYALILLTHPFTSCHQPWLHPLCHLHKTAKSFNPRRSIRSRINYQYDWQGKPMRGWDFLLHWTREVIFLNLIIFFFLFFFFFFLSEQQEMYSHWSCQVTQVFNIGERKCTWKSNAFSYEISNYKWHNMITRLLQPSSFQA
jgi:hypothetical protein